MVQTVFLLVDCFLNYLVLKLFIINFGQEIKHTSSFSFERVIEI